jgi:MFS family permease
MLVTTRLDRHNARQLYYEMFCYGILAGSALAFLAVYAARLGANSLQVGALTAGPALVNVFSSLPAARWLEGRSLIQTTLRTSLWYRAGFLALMLLPGVFAPAVEAWLLPALVTVMTLAGAVLAISFNAMFAEVIPAEAASAVVGRRNALLALSMSATSLACGWLLERLSFPFNYQVVFGIGAAGAGLSSLFLARLRPVTAAARVSRPLAKPAPPRFRFARAARFAAGARALAPALDRRLLRLDLLRGPFGPFIGAFLLFYTCQFLLIPVAPLYFVNTLGLTDSAISVGNALFHATTLLISMRLYRLTQRFGHQRVLAGGALAFGLYPLLAGLARDAAVYWAASLVGGVIWGLLAGALLTRLMERVPGGDRPAHMALHNLAMNVGILAGSLLGPLLADWLGLREVMFAIAGLRVAAGVVLLIWG